jgi:hypothetical protein
LRTGLPDGLFVYQISQFYCLFEGLGIENFGMFHGLLVFLGPFGSLYGHLVFFDNFGTLFPRKIWQPCMTNFKRKKLVKTKRDRAAAK